MKSNTIWFRPYGFEMVEDMYVFEVNDININEKEVFRFVWDESNNLFANLSEMREAIPYEKNRIFKDCKGLFYCEKRDHPVNWVDSLDKLCDMYLLDKQKENLISKWKEYINSK